MELQAILVGVIVGVGKILTEIGVPKKVIPVLNLTLGMAFGLIFALGDTMQLSALNGVIVGLTASGLYDLTKIVKK